MHPPEVRAEALALFEQGLNDCEISRRLAIPRRTILDWRNTPAKRFRRTLTTGICPRCWKPAKQMRFSAAEYAEFLGFYLGDGCISDGARTQRLRITLDRKYPAIIEAARLLLERCFPENPVGLVRYARGNCLAVSMYSSHLGCLVPQHGPGRKHERRIALELWQERILEAEPWPFIRACIWTDGCSFINRTDIHRPQPYEYLSYHFANMSRDIIDLFVDACAQVDVFTRINVDRRGLWNVRVNRRESVALMEANVGLKR